MNADRIFLSLIICSSALGCHSGPKPAPSFAEQVSNAHGYDSWKSQAALVGDVHVQFENGATFDAHFTYDVKQNRVRMLLPDETILVFDGQNAWVSPSTYWKLERDEYIQRRYTKPFW